jgi:catechol 2,3-dioxygenase-like lactoylglutathione lyase family enzyme
MTSIDSLTLETADPAAARRFYDDAFGLGDRIRVRAGETPTSGFRSFTVSIAVAQPADVQAFLDTALAAGATPLKPRSTSFWGVAGVVRAPDGAIWKIATGAKKDSGPASRTVQDIVLLLGVADIAASKRFYTERGLKIGKSFGKYAQIDLADDSPVKFGLYGRRMLAKDAGVDAEGSGSHRLTIDGTAAPATDPDGFVWEAAGA